MEREYVVEGYFSFRQKSTSPGSVRDSIKRLIIREGLEDKNFSIEIYRVGSRGETVRDEDLIAEDKPKVEPTKEEKKESVSLPIVKVKNRRGRKPGSKNKKKKMTKIKNGS